MRRWPVWAVPVLLLVLPVAGRTPVHRDLADFFLPMRQHTAAVLAGGEIPWLNPANGCGEPWFANPETGVLYPPHWLYVVVPPEWGMTLEIVFHLALLALGAGMVAWRLGAGPGGRRLAEAAAWCVGPVLALVGVVNNLDALAWLPWLVLAAGARRRVVPLTALAVAAGWLAGEPQVWALGVVLAVVMAPRRRRALLGVVLGTALVAVQLIPFAAWVLDGTRGPAAGAATLAGAVSSRGWLGVLVAGVAVAPAGAVPWAESLFLGAPLLTLALVAGRRRPLLLVPALLLGLFATLPAIGGGALYLMVTRGLVWYPSRFAVVGLATLLPLTGAGWRPWLEGEGRGLAALLGVGALVLSPLAPTPAELAVTVLPAGLLVAAALLAPRRWLRAAAVVAGLGGCIVAGLPFLASRPVAEVAAASRSPWPSAVTAGRLYSPPPPVEWLPALSESLAARAAWPVGYLNLEQGIRPARTWAPVASARLAQHLAAAERGPDRSWWVDALAARWVVVPRPVDWSGLVPTARGEGLWLYRNRHAWDLVALVTEPPKPGTGARLAPGLLTVSQRNASLAVAFAGLAPAWLRLSLDPTAGWRWWLDGRPVQLESGRGVVQTLAVTAGAHTLRGRYRPPGLGLAATVSLLALVLVATALVRRRHGVTADRITS